MIRVFVILLFTAAKVINCEKPIITHGPSEIFGLENQPVTLQCRIKSKYSLDVSWYINNTVVLDSSSFHIETSSAAENILISELTTHLSKTSAGSYYCNASNAHGWSTSSPADVIIAYMDESFVVQPQSKSASVGETVVFSCKPPNSSPKATVIWHKDDKEIALSNHAQMIENGDLRIDHINWLDAGIYWCVAKSFAFKKTSSKVYLRIQQRPFFLLAPVSQSVLVNGVVEFACHVSGDPQPVVTWIRDSNVATISISRSTLLSDGSLKLKNVQLEDAGDYICQGSSESGIAEAVAHLNVISSPGFIRTPPGNTVFLEGSFVELFCSASGSPTPEIRWINKKTSEYYVSGIKILSDRIDVSETGALIIKTARLSDSGSYECRASSSAGFTRSVTNLIIQPNPQLYPARIGSISPSIVKINKFNQLESAQLICSVPDPSSFHNYLSSVGQNFTIDVSNSAFKTFWYKGKQDLSFVISESNRIRIGTGGSLIISPILENDIGNYSCAIFNLINNRIAFWQFKVLFDSIPNDFSNVASFHSIPLAPSHVQVSGVGSTWITLKWDYPNEDPIDSDIRFHVFYLLQFRESNYVSKGQARNFHVSSNLEEHLHYYNEDPTDGLMIDERKQHVDYWEHAVKSTREKNFRLDGLFIDSGYWIEIRAFSKHGLSQGYIIPHIVYTSYSSSILTDNSISNIPSSKLYGIPASTDTEFKDLLSRIHSFEFRRIAARTLTPSEVLVTWTIRSTSGAVRLIDGFQITAKPVFMSRCSASATSPSKDLLALKAFESPALISSNIFDSSLSEHSHCSFDNEVLIERFRHASVSAGKILESNLSSHQAKSFDEKIILVSRAVSRDKPSTGAIIGNLHPFTCYEVTVKAFKNDFTYGRMWSRETQAELVLSLDAAPSQAPRLLSANWMQSRVDSSNTQNSFSRVYDMHSIYNPLLFVASNDSMQSNHFASIPNAIRLKWTQLDLHLSHGTLLGYSIHLIANSTTHSKIKKVSPDVFSYDIVGIDPSVEYTIFLAGITCRGEGVRGPGYRMPVIMTRQSIVKQTALYDASNFPIWAYGAVSGILLIWLFIGLIILACVRRHKPYPCCCFPNLFSESSTSEAKVVSNSEDVFCISRNIASYPLPSSASSVTKSSHVVPLEPCLNPTASAPLPDNSSDGSCALPGQGFEMRCMPTNINRTESNANPLIRPPQLISSNSEQRLGPKSDGSNHPSQEDTFNRSISSGSTPTMHGRQGCFNGQRATHPPNTTVADPAYSIICSTAFAQQSNGMDSSTTFLMKRNLQTQLNPRPPYEHMQWGDAQTMGYHDQEEVPPYACSSVLPLDIELSLEQSSGRMPISEATTNGMHCGNPLWLNFNQKQSHVNGHGLSTIASSGIPPPPPYPPPPLPSTMGKQFSSPTAAGCDQFRHTSDDGSQPSGGSYFSGYYSTEGVPLLPVSRGVGDHLTSVDEQRLRQEVAESVSGGSSLGSGQQFVANRHLSRPPQFCHQHHAHNNYHQRLGYQTASVSGGARTTATGSSSLTGSGSEQGNSPSVAHHGFMTGGTLSSNESANYPLLPRGEELRTRPVGGCPPGALSTSSGSHNSSQPRLLHPSFQYSPPSMGVVGTSSLPQTASKIRTLPQQPTSVTHPQFEQDQQQEGSFENQRSSVDMADNMTYSEVNSTDGDRDGDIDDESDFDKACSSSAYGEHDEHTLDIDFIQPPFYQYPQSIPECAPPTKY